MKYWIYILIFVLVCAIVIGYNIKAVQDMYVSGDLDVENNFTGNQIYGAGWYHNHSGFTMDFGTQSVYYNLFMAHYASFFYQKQT